MMKKGFKIVLMIICSAMFLTACNGGDIEVKNDIAKENAEYARETFDVLKGNDFEIDNSTEEWGYMKCGECTYYDFDSSPIGGTAIVHNSIVIHTEDKKMSWWMRDDDGFSMYVLKDAPHNHLSENGLDNTENECSSEVCDFIDGQRFECFETVAGEDIILTVHLFYSDESDVPSDYKGELSNGVEFWFVPYESSEEYITYKIDCSDGTSAYMKYNTLSSEIEFTADEGTEYGNMYAYSGTYIGLPDEIEE